jgi:hypothetical protein
MEDTGFNLEGTGFTGRGKIRYGGKRGFQPTKANRNNAGFSPGGTDSFQPDPMPQNDLMRLRVSLEGTGFSPYIRSHKT